MSETTRAQAEALESRGYAVFEGLYAPGELDFLRSRLIEAYDALGRPATFANPPVEFEDVEIARVGMVFHQLGRRFPEFADRLLKPAFVEVVRSLLGDDMHLEYTGAVLCNDARPFFPWHAHVGGVNNVVYRKQALFPSFERSERITLLLYLDDLTTGDATLLVYPRAIHESTRPPYDPTLEDWEGRVELPCSRGTVVLLEQCTWHAARPKRSPGIRTFIACYFTSRRAPPSSWADESFRASADPHGLLHSVLAGASAGRLQP